MQVGFYGAVGAMRILLDQQEIIAGNLARQGIAGHRASVPAFMAEAPARPQARQALDRFEATGRSDLVAPAPLRLVTQTRFDQGPVQRTENPLHLAIEGDAFFRVQGPDGQPGFTRNGAFTRLANGILATAEGFVLLDEGGQPLNVANPEQVSVGRDGLMLVAGQAAGRVGVARFADPGATLRETLPGLFRPVAGVPPLPGFGARDRLIQGALEGSNASPVEQLVALTSVVRAYEANQRQVTAQDDATSRLIRATAPAMF